MKCRVAIVQFRTKLHDPAHNLERMAGFVRRARRGGAHVVVFPEEFLTGPLRSRLDLADGRGAYRAAFQQLAHRHRIDVVAGSVVERVRGRCYNTCYYLDAAGRVLGRYRKMNLWLTERSYATAGRRPSCFRTSYGTVGLSICWDLAFPELYRACARRGAQIVFNTSLWSRQDAGPGLRFAPSSEKRFVDACCVARAFENELFVVYCNAAGTWTLDGRRYESIGHSQVAAPFHGAMARLAHNREQMLLQEIDTKLLDVAERAYRIRADLQDRRAR
jgi:predicted amidohydrolase